MFAIRVRPSIVPKGEDGHGKVGEHRSVGVLTQAGIDLRPSSPKSGGDLCNLGSTKEPTSAAPNVPMGHRGSPLRFH